MTNEEDLLKHILYRHSYDGDINNFFRSFLDKMKRDHRLEEVSVKFCKLALTNFNLESIKLLIRTYYYPNYVGKDEYYSAIKLLSLFFSYNSDYPFDNTRLNLIKRFVDEGNSFVDKEYRTLFMYDLHILLQDDDDIAFFMTVIDYKELIDFLDNNDISFRSIEDKDKFNKISFNYQCNFIKNNINNYNKRTIL